MLNLAKFKVNLCLEAKLVKTQIFPLCALCNFSCIYKVVSKHVTSILIVKVYLSKLFGNMPTVHIGAVSRKKKEQQQKLCVPSKSPPIKLDDLWKYTKPLLIVATLRAILLQEIHITN